MSRGSFQLHKFPFILLLILMSLTPGSVINAQEKPSRIAVRGADFINAEGETVIFRGLNIADPAKLLKDGRWSRSHFEEVKKWGANLVRLPVHPSAWRELGEDKYTGLIDQAIGWAGELDMYLIIDWHSIGNLKSELFYLPMYNTTKKETYEFWRTMATRYGDESTIAFFELFNEPTTYQGKLGQCSWKEWKEIMEELIVIIRANGSQNIPLVAGFNWGYDLRPVREDPVDAPNIAYVSHPYPQKRERPWEDKWNEDWGFVADKYPMVLTEIGFCAADVKGAHVPVISDPDYVDYIDKYTEKRGVSYCVWVFDPDWSPMLIKDWSYSPTDAGAVWKDLWSTKKK